MTSFARRDSAQAGLVLPSLLLVALLGIVGAQTGLLTLPAVAPAGTPETVVIAPRSYAYRATGEFLRNGASVDGPLVALDDPPPLEIMKYQVSAADYAACVADGGCALAEPRRRGIGNVPVTGVSFRDATDYADWLTRRTGARWRLPTIEEWTFAAGSKTVDPALGLETDAADPAERWLLQYEREAALGDRALATPEPLGSFGVNEFGVADLSAVVWEWTATCASRTTVDATGNVVTFIDSCGVRYLEGRHRTAMNVFVRDAVAGGCTIGAPPDNLGFRLVREPTLVERMLYKVRSFSFPGG
jgi:formylglycine-generating enzyme required for sulfatase activity